MKSLGNQLHVWNIAYIFVHFFSLVSVTTLNYYDLEERQKSFHREQDFDTGLGRFLLWFPFSAMYIVNWLNGTLLTLFTLRFGGQLFQQMVGIPMGTNCAPLLADLFLYSYENKFLDKLIKEGQRKRTRKFNLSYCYIDDLISFNNKRFKKFISDICPKELTISETTESTSVASYLDLLFTRDKGNNITTKLDDKRDAFSLHIVNFPFISSNIPSAPAYGVYASQLIRYACCCSNYSEFLSFHRALVARLLLQGYKVNRLSNTFKKLYGRHTNLVGQYKKNVCQMFADSISWNDFLMDVPMAELIKWARVAGVMHEADHAYSIQNTWWLHRLATDVPFISCVINSPCTFTYHLDLSNFIL